MKAFRYLKDRKRAILLIIIFLVIQATCELALPSYTSDIVNVGVTNGGFADSIPLELSQTSYDSFQIFMTDDEKHLINDSYELTSKNTYKLKQKKSKLSSFDTINDSFGYIFLLQASLSEDKLAEFSSQLKTDGINHDSIIIENRKQLTETLRDTYDNIALQSSKIFLQNEYETIGISSSKIQINYMLSIGWKMLLITFIAAISAIIVSFISTQNASKVSYKLRTTVFKKILSFSNTEIDQLTSASLITRSTNDIQQIQMTCGLVFRMILFSPIMAFGSIIRVANSKANMSWIIALSIVLVFLIIITLLKLTLPRFKKMQKLIDKLNLVSREILTGLPVIRAFSREKHEKKRFDKASRDLMETQLFTNRAMALMMPLMSLLMNCVSVAIVWFGAKGIDAGTLQLGELTAFINYSMHVIMSFMLISMVAVMLPRANVSTERVEEILNTEVLVKDPLELLHEDKDDFKGIVEYRNVSFHYAGADENVISHINFIAKPGQTTAIIGSTGSGKSTIINLLPRLYDVTGGQVLIDNIDIRELSPSKLRNMIGFVPQKGNLFSGTIESNISFGQQLDRAVLEKAATIAQATSFISEKEDGFDSVISQGGSNVSGGQKQRLSIARALAKSPKICVFDDSFSALDFKTDVALRRALHDNLKDSTIIIVAQRISTILHADQILVLDQGEIKGVGTHKELLSSCETYLEIAKSQLSETELSSYLEKEGISHE